MDILPFVKPLNVILTELFVLIKQNWNFERKYDYKQFKYKIISSLDCCLFAAKFCVDIFTSFILLVIVRTICLTILKNYHCYLFLVMFCK